MVAQQGTNRNDNGGSGSWQRICRQVQMIPAGTRLLRVGQGCKCNWRLHWILHQVPPIDWIFPRVHHRRGANGFRDNNDHQGAQTLGVQDIMLFKGEAFCSAILVIYGMPCSQILVQRCRRRLEDLLVLQTNPYFRIRPRCENIIGRCRLMPRTWKMTN